MRFTNLFISLLKWTETEMDDETMNEETAQFTVGRSSNGIDLLFLFRLHLDETVAAFWFGLSGCDTC